MLPLAEARKMFFSRLDRAAMWVAFEHVGFSDDPGWLTYYLKDTIQPYEGVRGGVG